MTAQLPRGSRGDLPTGREQVRAAILTAATELFAERGPAATSIRDIAARSKVNHGLVFRHFGSKENLVGAVLDHLGAELAELLRSQAPADSIEHAMDIQTRVMARAVLDGYPAGQLQQHFPNVADVLNRVRGTFDDETQARIAVANALALQFGWRLFEPVVRAATGLDDVAEADIRDAMRAGLARLLEPR